MPPPLRPNSAHPRTDRHAGHPPRTAWAMALAGAGGVCSVLALVPGLGIYLALVAIPVLYAVGVPLAVHTFARTVDRERHWVRLVGGGAVVGALVPIVVSLFTYLFTGPFDGVLLGQVMICAAAGLVVAAIALVGAATIPTRRRTAVAIGGPTLLLISATVQLTLWL